MSAEYPKRSDICDKWHRYCIECGKKQLKDSGRCTKCDANRWTRNKKKVKN